MIMKKTILIVILTAGFFLSADLSYSQTLKEKFETGKKAFYSDDFDKANKLFSEILNMTGGDYDVCLYKGMVYYIYFDYDKALAEISNAI